MNTIKLNNEYEYEINNYSRNINFYSITPTLESQQATEGINSNAYFTITSKNVSDLDDLSQETITSIEIFYNETSIYKLENVNAKVESINENLNTDQMIINVNLKFIIE